MDGEIEDQPNGAFIYGYHHYSPKIVDEVIKNTKLVLPMI
jgi:hypothetical protein